MAGESILSIHDTKFEKIGGHELTLNKTTNINNFSENWNSYNIYCQYFEILPSVYDITSKSNNRTVVGNVTEEGCFVELNISAIKLSNRSKEVIDFKGAGKLKISNSNEVVSWEGFDIKTKKLSNNMGTFGPTLFKASKAKIYVRASRACNSKIEIVDLTGSISGNVDVKWENEPKSEVLILDGVNSKGFKKYKCLNDESVKLIKIPASSFYKGDNSYGKATEIFSDSYYISETPITNRQFNLWRSQPTAKPLAGSWKFDETKADHPVVNITWLDAHNYSCWLFNDEKKCHLPSSEQFEKAMRGPNLSGLNNGYSSKLWPWGDVWNGTLCNNNSSGTLPVNHFEPQGYFGLFDLSGNVWEWCSDEDIGGIYTKISSFIKTSSKSIIIKGGSWRDKDSNVFKCSYATSQKPDFADNNISFRVAWKFNEPK